jgi:hypothetical protein
MKTEVRRGRKFIEYQDDSLPAGTFVQEIGVHDVSYQDEQGAWLPADENWETDGLDGFSFRAQRMNHKVRFDSIGAWRWYPRRNVETEYIIINRPKCWLTRTNRWGNLLVNGISREGRDITLTSLRNVTRVIHSSWNGIKTDWILENADAPTRFQQQIDLVGLTEVDGWLYGADGEQVARLTPTIAIDAEGNELPTSTSYENGILEFSADVTGAVFPVVIDPDYAGDTGDGYILGNATGETSISSNLTNAYLQCGWAGNGTTFRQIARAYFKFDTSGIDDSHTITQVNLKLTPYSVTKAAGGAYFDVLIKKYDWGSLTLTDATDRETAYDGAKAASQDNSIWQNTANISANTQYASGNLATAWISKTGYTYYALMGKMDQDGETYDSGELSNVYFCSADHATEAYRPVLTVAHSAGGAQNLTLTCAAGSYSLTGTNADLTVTRHYTLTCEAGSYALTGANADLTVTRHYTLTCEAGSYSLTGTNVDLTVKRNYALACSAGNYLITGTDATLTVQRNYTLVCEPGSYSLTGTDITFGNSKAYSLTCEAGAYTLTGSNVSFVIQRNYSLACETGSYTLTGSDVTLTYTQGAQNFTLACEVGSYALTGTNAGLTSARTMACNAGSYTLTGTNADFYRALVMACEAGSYALTGTNASLTSHRIFALGVGSYVLVGTSVGLFILTPTPACRTYTIDAEGRLYTIAGDNRTYAVLQCTDDD